MQRQFAKKSQKVFLKLLKIMLPFSTKTIKFIESCFKHINITLKAGEFELQVNFTRNKENPVEQIIDVLTGLEKIAAHHKKRVVVFIDEFQDFLKADQSDEIQAAIRSVAQHTQYVSFIFSGSSRNMLRKIFEDRNQPLYMLCKKIHLKKIAEKEFEKHMQKSAKKHWKKTLDISITENILNLTECHPYYLNLLCDNLWDQAVPPSLKQVTSTWKICLEEQKDKLIADLKPLSATRVKVISAIAIQNGVAAPTGKDFLNSVGLALGTVQKAFQYLIGHDFIYHDELLNKVKLVDPLLQLFIVNPLNN